MAEQNPNNFMPLGYEAFILEFSTLVSSYPPPFIYINDPFSIRTTSSVVDSLIKDLRHTQCEPDLPDSLKICSARIDATTCFNSRIFYDHVINDLADWEPSWEDGCENWAPGDEGHRWNESFDTFIHGLRAVHAHVATQNEQNTEAGGEQYDVRMVLVIERPEKLKENLPDLIIPLTRLQELTRLDLTVVFIGEIRWHDIKPSLGASLEPYYFDIHPPKKDDVVKRLTTRFHSIAQPTQDGTILLDSDKLATYHLSLFSLYAHFISVLCDVCFPFTNDFQELEYIAAARWPGFAKPVIDQHMLQVREEVQVAEEMNIDVSDDPENVQELASPPTDVRMRLSRVFNPSLSAALEALYPRITNARAWAAANEPDPDILTSPASAVRPMKGVLPTHEEWGVTMLPRMSKFLLIAGFLASTNPAKSDLRMFGRGLDEKKRKRRARKAPGKAKSGPSKLPQRLIGPAPFVLDRLIAILGALLEENDVDSRLPSNDFAIPGEYTDMEVGRVGIYGSIMELVSKKLFHRTSPPDRLDGPPMFKSNLSYEMTLVLARQLDVPLNDLMWDPV